MTNDPSPDERRVHPLEREPQRPSDPSGEPTGSRPSQTVILRIPSVRPLATYVLLGINLAVFIIRALSPELDIQIFLWGANYAPAVIQDGEIYRLLTSMFLHASIYDVRGNLAPQFALHLALNSYIIWTAGTQLERLFGHARYLIIYLLGGITGSIFSVVFGGGAYSVGASGAVFAILGAEFVYIYKHRLLLGARAQQQMRSLISLAVINLLFGILSNVGNAAIRIDNWGHIGGAIGGLALAWFISPYFLPRRHPERPQDLIADDVNPLRAHYAKLSLYGAGLMLLLVAARTLGIGMT
ncbi:rhomboid family intramembrane serine protease [Anaerolineae bacterium CFX9]|jgi:rhomboid protease GluP|nr:rhomboid family intramembrane serine protease [Anaerolineae bacterium CFX9]